DRSRTAARTLSGQSRQWHKRHPYLSRHKLHHRLAPAFRAETPDVFSGCEGWTLRGVALFNVVAQPFAAHGHRADAKGLGADLNFTERIVEERAIPAERL